MQGCSYFTATETTGYICKLYPHADGHCEGARYSIERKCVSNNVFKMPGRHRENYPD